MSKEPNRVAYRHQPFIEEAMYDRFHAIKVLCSSHMDLARTFAQIAADTHRHALQLLEAHTAELARGRERPDERVRECPSRPRNDARKQAFA